MRLVEFYQDSKDYYDDFVIGQKHTAFLQSWAWGEFQQSLGKKVWRLGIKQGHNLVATATIINQPLPLDKSYLYIPRGPLMLFGLNKDRQQEIIELILSKARDICYMTKKENEIFSRLEPDLTCLDESILTLPLIKKLDVQPQHTWVLDLSPDIKKLQKKMHHKTRYNINLAERKGVKIKQSNNPKDLNKFLFLAKITAARAGFSIWPDNYYLQLFEVLNKHQMIAIWLAEYKHEILVANMVVNFGDTVTYLYGGSANKFKEVMASHLLQWRQITWAKENDYDYYDFWGIAPKGSNKEQAWQGITRFKKSFGGQELNYLGSYDFIYSNFWYGLYNMIKKFKP